MSSTPIDWSPNDASLLALLVAGHMLADFVLQPWRMVVRKRTSLGWLFAHGAVVLGAHGLLLAPFYFGGGRALALAAAIALTHVVIDRAKIGAERRFGRRLGVFGLDQAAHLAVILAAWSLLRSAGLVPAPGPLCLDPEILGQGAICLSAFAFVINGGSATVAGVLRILGGTAPKGEEDSGAPHAGHLIGILERLVILPLAWHGQWPAIGFVLAAKSVARFKDLEQRAFAETYLVGTLTSFLVVSACGLLLRWLVPLD